MGAISNELVDRIKSTANIVDIILQYITLTKKGANYFGKCPFHNEKTGSFSVSQAKQMYKCFSCGKGGDVFSFIQEKENVSFPEAVRIVAKKYSIDIPDVELSSEEIARIKERETRLIVLEKAYHFFVDNLSQLSSEDTAMQYLMSRQIDARTLQLYGCGVASSGNTMLSQMKYFGYGEAMLKELGLIGMGDRGSYDYFRSRIVFPFYNMQGKVIGFTGRVIDNTANTAKYLNSPETPFFKKGDVLFGLYQAKKRISETGKVFLVEGQFDVLSFANWGVTNTVAGSGTALTPNQVALLAKFASSVTVVYDSDTAGFQASIKNIKALVSAGLAVKAVRLPDGVDPDDVAKLKKDKLGAYLLNEEMPFIAYLWAILYSDDPLKSASCVATILESIRLCPDLKLQNAYLKTLSSLSGMSLDSLTSEMASMRLDASKYELVNMPDGFYGLDEAKGLINSKNEDCILVQNFEEFSSVLGVEPVVYFKGKPSPTQIQALRLVSNSLRIENPRISIKDRREDDALLCLKDIYKANFLISVVNSEEKEMSFINFYVDTYREAIEKCGDNTDVIDIYIARVVELISFAPETTRIRMTKEWASSLGLPSEKALKDLLKPFIEQRKSKKTQAKEKLEKEADIMAVETEFVPDYVTSNEEMMQIYNRYGFYPLLNKKGEAVSYMFRTEGNNHTRVADFYMEPLLHIYDKEKEFNKRVMKLNSMYSNKPKYVEWKSTVFANLTAFNEMLIMEGSFNFENGDIKHYKKIWYSISRRFQYCYELKVFGQQDEDFFAFSNAIFHKVDGVYRIDKVSSLGVVEHKDVSYYSPAFSEIYASERKDTDKYAQDRWLVYDEIAPENQTSFQEWASLMDRVYKVNNNGKWALIYAIMSAFRSVIYPIDRLFTSIFFIGPTMSGKTQIAVSIRSLFIKPDAPSFNLNSGTDAAFFSILERFRDVPQIMEEYNDDQISDQKFQGLKSVTYDGDGKQKRKSVSGNDVETSQVNAPVILLGQESPQKDDNALSNRVILCDVPKVESWSEEEQNIFEQLKYAQKKGLSNILFEVLKLRPLFQDHFISIQRTVKKEIQNHISISSSRSGDQTRIINTVSLFLATCKLLVEYAPHLKLPFSYEEFVEIAVAKVTKQVEGITKTDKISTFFNTCDFLLDKKIMMMGRDIKIVTPAKIKLKGGEEISLSPVDTRVLYMNLTNVHRMYQNAQIGDKHLTYSTLEANLRSHPAYIGVVKAAKFKWFEASDVPRGGFTDVDGESMPNTELRRVMEMKQKNTSAVVLNYDILTQVMGIDFEREIADENSFEEKPF